MSRVEQATEARLLQIRDEARNSDYGLVGKAQRIAEDPRGDYSYSHEGATRFGGGFFRQFPELGVRPLKTIAAAIERRKGKVFREIRDGVQWWVSQHVTEPRGRKERPTVPGHDALTRKCKRCGRPHGKSAHRFHGQGAFLRTHLFPYKFNPGVSMTITQAKQYVVFYRGLMRQGMALVRRERELLASAGRLLKQARRPGIKKNPRGIPKRKTKRDVHGRFKRMYADWKKTGFRKPLKKNGTATRTEVRSPTSTSTRALTRGNTTLTITGNGNSVRVPRGRNPPGRPIIYHRLLRIEAKKGPGHRCDAACKRADHSYFHDFKAGAVVYGMPDGSVLIRSNQGKRLWNYF